MALQEAVREPSSIQGQVSPEEWATRVNLAAAHRLAALEGWVPPTLVYNHFAARVPDDPSYMLIKRHSLMFGEVTASNLLKLNMKGRSMGFADDVNPVGFVLHSAVLTGSPSNAASIHVHTKEGVALSCMKEGLLPLNQESIRYYKRTGYLDFEGYEDSIEETGKIQRALGNNLVLILRNHGLLVAGPTVSYAMQEMGILLLAAQIQHEIFASGREYIVPSPEICDEVANSVHTVGEQPAAWDAVKRYLDRIDRSYRS